MGTVEFTGLVMTQIMAFGQFLKHRGGIVGQSHRVNATIFKGVVTDFAQASTRFFTIDAFVLKRSSRVIPKKTSRHQSSITVCVCVHACVDACMCVLCVFVYVRVCTCMHVCFVCVCACTCVCMYIPGFLGTPAGMMTTSAFCRAPSSCSGPRWPVT